MVRIWIVYALICINMKSRDWKQKASSPNFHLEALFFDMHPNFLERGLLSDVSNDEELLEREITS
jgi:hypothetical protein